MAWDSSDELCQELEQILSEAHCELRRRLVSKLATGLKKCVHQHAQQGLHIAAVPSDNRRAFAYEDKFIYPDSNAALIHLGPNVRERGRSTRPVGDAHRKTMQDLQHLVCNAEDLLATEIPYYPEPQQEGYVAALVNSNLFEVISAIILFANVICTLVETNQNLEVIDHDPHAPFIYIEYAFNIYYLLEFLLKLFVYRKQMFHNMDKFWNIFDLCLLVITWTIDLTAIIFSGEGQQTSGLIRIVRLLRVARVFRMMRLMRFISELRLMLRCIFGSLFSCFWSFVLIGVFTLAFAVGLVQQITDALIDFKSQGNKDVEKLRADVAGFSSVQQAVMTLFQGISGGTDWGDIYDSIKGFGFSSSMLLSYILFVWLAVTNIISSLFVEKAVKFAKPSMWAMLNEKLNQDLQVAEELNELFTLMKKEPTLTLSLEEFEDGLTDVHISTMLELRGILISDTHEFFGFLAAMSENHAVDKDSFVSGCLKLRGQAMHSDVLSLLYQTRSFTMKFSKNLAECKALLHEICESVHVLTFNTAGDSHQVPKSESSKVPRHTRTRTLKSTTAYAFKDTSAPCKLSRPVDAPVHL